MPLQAIMPQFSRGITTAMSNASDSINRIGDYANKYLADEENKRRYEKEQQRLDKQEARQQVLDDRATILWNEQQAEKEMLKNAGLMKAVEADTLNAMANQGYNKALDEWRLSGMKTPAPVIQDYPMNLQGGIPNVNINAGPINAGTAGGAIFKNVTTQVPAGTAPAVQPATTAPVAAQPATPVGTVTDTTSAWGGLNLPKTSGDTLDSLSKERTALLRGGANYTGMPSDHTRQMKPEAKARLQDIDNRIANQRILTTGATNLDSKTSTPTKSTSITQEKVDAIMSPKTPEQKKASDVAMKTITQKVQVGVSSGKPPKFNQVEADVINKLYASINPYAAERQQAQANLESMYYSLGMKPAQVEEYTKGAVDKIFGKENDPVKMAQVNSLLSAYEKNTTEGNRIGMELYKLNTEVGLKNAEMSQRERLSKGESDKLPPGYTIWTNPKTGKQEAVLLSTAQKAEASGINQNTPEGKAAYQATINKLYNDYRTTFSGNDKSWFGKAPMSFQQWQKAGMPPL